MMIRIPNPCMVVLVGASGSGKSTFARAHFKPTQVLSSDYCRGLVADDENAQWATKDAFEVLHYIAGKRMAGNRLTVIDATNVQPAARKSLVELARAYHFLPVAVVFDIPEEVCLARNRDRSDRDFGPHVIRQQTSQLRKSLRHLRKEGFRHVFTLGSELEVAEASIDFDVLFNNKEHELGPFDLIGDIHGCYDELLALLHALGYRVNNEGRELEVTPPEGRRAIFLGDLVDRGPKIVEVLRLVRGMTGAGTAFCVPGNHDIKLARKLGGRDVKVAHGLAESLEQLEEESPEFREDVRRFLDGLTSHFVFDGGKLVAAHAGMKESMQGRASGRVRDFALYGETTGETDEFGLPIRYPWAAEYRGKAMVVYGHTPAVEPDWVNNTINIDTGCVFGGRLTALRYPEKELVSVAAARVYSEPVRPLAPAAEIRPNDLLDIGDVIGKRVVETRLRGNVTVREENAAAALEVMSRFAVNPHWLIYLPPTMAPSETSTVDGFLEHPSEALGYFRSAQAPSVVCEEKHMGSRAVVIVCRDERVVQKRFGIKDEGIGICYTRTGRRFLDEPALEQGLLYVVHNALTAAGLWEELQTDWLCLDCELMPWSMKAQELIRRQYAAVGAAADIAVGAAMGHLARAGSRGVDLSGVGDSDSLLSDLEREAHSVQRFRDAYRRYCWPVNTLADLRLAPFHILAGEAGTFVTSGHEWHMNVIARLCDADPTGVLVKTPWMRVDVDDESSVRAAIEWWIERTESGSEGTVVKPADFIHRGRRGLMQPGLKCRGREYLRIIYGPNYDSPSDLTRLRKRALHAKRSLALREFALGVEALERFAAREPLYRVHECVFGVLALESEPVDPRL